MLGTSSFLFMNPAPVSASCAVDITTSIILEMTKMVSLRSIVLVATILYAADDRVSRFAVAFSSPFVLSSQQRRLSSSFSSPGRVSVRSSLNRMTQKASSVTRGARTTQLSMAIDRMSNDCVAGIQKVTERISMTPAQV